MRKTKIKFIISVCLVAASIIVLNIGITQRKAETQTAMQQDIAREVLRFHVIANSDSDEDQALKLHVRDRVLQYLRTQLSDAETIAETRQRVEARLEEIKSIAQDVVFEKGYAYEIGVSVTKESYPECTYGECVLPAGLYTSLQIRIGKADGHNWWCMLYPSLCFVDETHGIVTEETKELLAGRLTADEYDWVTQKSSNKVHVTYRWFR